jgi:hypothetical protein
VLPHDRVRADQRHVGEANGSIAVNVSPNRPLGKSFRLPGVRNISNLVEVGIVSNPKQLAAVTSVTIPAESSRSIALWAVVNAT